MSVIRYICVSDLHLGASNGVLTGLDSRTWETDLEHPSPVLAKLGDCLEELVRLDAGERKPTLVLAGDILEMALATLNVGATVFEQFIDELLGQKRELVDERVLYVPGNHDHHLWETARERQYAAYLATVPSGKVLRNTPWHGTHLFLKEREEERVWNVVQHILTTVLHRDPKRSSCRVQAVYPNLGIMAENGDSRCVVFHHGHFTESIYRMITTLRSIVFPGRPEPMDAWDIEAENYAWVDFLWGTLGRSGAAGEDVGLLYRLLGSDRGVRYLASNISKGLSERLVRRGAWLVRPPLRWVIRRLITLVADMERGDVDEVLSQGGEQGLDNYVSTAVLGQLEHERPQQLPEELTFVFGHTHKPFSGVRRFSGFGRPVQVYNTGGWVVDTLEPAHAQGAAAILVDENSHAVSLRLYNQGQDPPRIRLERADADAPGNNPLFDRLAAQIDPERSPWLDLAATTKQAVDDRRHNLALSVQEGVKFFEQVSK